MRDTRIAVLVLVLSLPATLAVAAEQSSTLPAGEPPLWSRTYRIHGSDHPVRLLKSEAGWRIVGWSGWRDTEESKDWHESWWVLDMNVAGQRQKLHEFPSRSNRTQVWDAAVVGSELVVLGGGLGGTMARVSADGKLVSNTDLREETFVHPKALSVTKDGGLLVAGSTSVKGEPDQDAWLGRFREDGEKQWSERFDREQDETAWDVVALPDSGCVVAINSGKYGKFGQGPSSVWLLHYGADDEKKEELVIEGGRVMIGRGHLVQAFGGVALSYTTTDFPGIRSGSREPGFDTQVVLFDQHLGKKWQRECPPAMLGSGRLQIDGEGRLVVVSALFQRIVVTRLDEKGGVLGTEVTNLGNGLSTLDIAMEKNAILVLGEETVRGEGDASKGTSTTRPHHDRNVVLMKLRQ